MICPACGSNAWTFERRYNTLDKYEQWVGIVGPVCRAWYRCGVCGLLKARHSYDRDMLLPIYTNGYRAKSFRDKTIEQEFMRIVGMPKDLSENHYRIRFFGRFINPDDTILDVGAGLGVFLDQLFVKRKNKFAIEPNKDSVQFLNEKLGIECKHAFYKPGLFDKQFDWVSCVHVLEHQEHPEDMLLDIKKDLAPGGGLIIEVPDACEFETLDKDNDEFNSTHFMFFSLQSLVRLVEGCHYDIADIHRVTTKARGLGRIMMVAHANR